MACCCSGYKVINMPRPTVAIIGATGYVGKFVTEAFITAAANEGWVEELRVLTRSRSAVVDEFERQGVIINVVDFSINETLVAALIGVSVVVCTIGTEPGTDESKKALLNALCEAGVKIYFPSEFGTNHYTRVKSYQHPIFEAKKSHFQEALGKKFLKVIGLMCSNIMERTFGPSCELDAHASTWKVVGKGKVPVAVTSECDVGQFTVAAVFIAFKNPKKVPRFLEVYSDMRSITGYAKVFKNVTGKPTKLEFIPLVDAVKQYNSTQDFSKLIQLLFEEGANNYKGTKDKKLLNPWQYVWKLKTVQEYAEETAGRK